MSINNTIDRIELLKELWDELQSVASNNVYKSKGLDYRKREAVTKDNHGLYAAMMMIHKRINKLNGGNWYV